MSTGPVPSARPLPERLRLLARFFGSAVLWWTVAGIGGCIALGVVELGASFFLQLFLRSLGILKGSLSVPFIDKLSPSPAFIAIALCVIAFLRGIGQLLYAQSSVQALEMMNGRLRSLAVYDMLLRGPVVPASKINADVADTFPKAATACFFGVTFLGSAFQTSVIAIAMIGSAPREAILGLVCLGFVGVLILRINRRIRREASHIPKEQLLIAQSIERIARNFRLVRVLRVEEVEAEHLNGRVRAVEHHALVAAWLANIATALTPFLGTLLLTLIIFASEAVFGTPGIKLLAFLYLFIRFVQQVGSTFNSLSTINHYWPQLSAAFAYFSAFDTAHVERAIKLYGAPPQLRLRASKGSTDGKPPAIAIDGVTFAYDATTPAILSKLSFQVAPGSQIGIIGASGSGKSTLLGLVIGLLDPQAGSIQIDGVSPRAYFGGIARRIGYVGAEAFLIGGTIRENLLYGCARDVDDAEIWRALESARLKATIEQIPGALDYKISENGEGLSAGQQQRLCLARAFLNEPQVLILDEASANLDAETEAEIAESLRMLLGRCTTVIVSHREGILKYAERVVDLDAVKAAARGDRLQSAP